MDNVLLLVVKLVSIKRMVISGAPTLWSACSSMGHQQNTSITLCDIRWMATHSMQDCRDNSSRTKQNLLISYKRFSGSAVRQSVKWGHPASNAEPYLHTTPLAKATTLNFDPNGDNEVEGCSQDCHGNSLMHCWIAWKCNPAFCQCPSMVDHSVMMLSDHWLMHTAMVKHTSPLWRHSRSPFTHAWLSSLLKSIRSLCVEHCSKICKQWQMTIVHSGGNVMVSELSLTNQFYVVQGEQEMIYSPCFTQVITWRLDIVSIIL